MKGQEGLTNLECDVEINEIFTVHPKLLWASGQVKSRNNLNPDHSNPSTLKNNSAVWKEKCIYWCCYLRCFSSPRSSGFFKDDVMLMLDLNILMTESNDLCLIANLFFRNVWILTILENILDI